MPRAIPKRLLYTAMCIAQLSWAAPPNPSEGAASAMQESLQKQQASLGAQANSLRQQSIALPPLDQDPFFSSAPAAAAEVSCFPLARPVIDSLIQSAGKKSSLDPDLLRAVMKEESAFRPCAISPKGALGLMQLMPSTVGQFHVIDPFDPEQNLEAGAAFLKQLLAKYKGDLKSSLIAYNAGAGRADRTDLPIPVETQSYLVNIFADLGIERVDTSVTPRNNSAEWEEEPDPLGEQP